MSNQDFDEFIKGKLKDLTEEKSDSDWSAFSELLKKEEAFANLDLKEDKDSQLNDDVASETQKNTQFDDQVSEKLNAHETIYRETHWKALRARLEREEYLRKNLYSTKLIETTAILLLFFAFIYVNDVQFDGTSKADESTFAHLYQKEKHTTSFEDHITKVVTKINDVIDKVTSNYDINIKENISPQVSVKSQQLFEINENRSIEPIAFLEASTILIDRKTKFAFPKESVSKLARIETSMQSISQDYPKLALSEKIAQIKKASLNKFELGIYVSQGIVGIQSEYDNVYNIQGASSVIHNTNYGFTFAAGTDHLKIYSGIEKSSRTYTPPSVNETYGSADTGYKIISLTSIQQNTARIPLGVKYTPFISSNGKNKVSALINVGGNIITSANYDISNVRLAPSIRPDQTLSSSRSNREEPLLFNKSFEKGALNDGLVLENFYLDAGLDIAYERKLTKRIDLMGGISYSKYLGGSKIGPNKDSYNQYHIKLGLNYTL